MANISLTEHQEKFLKAKVKSGGYTSASEVVREALRLFEEKERTREEKLQDLRRGIAVARKQMEAGQEIGGKAVFRELRRENEEHKKRLEK